MNPKKFPLDSMVLFSIMTVLSFAPWAGGEVYMIGVLYKKMGSGWALNFMDVPVWVAFFSIGLAYTLDLLRAYQLVEVKRWMIVASSLFGTVFIGASVFGMLFAEPTGNTLKFSVTAVPYLMFAVALMFTILTTRKNRFIA